MKKLMSLLFITFSIFASDPKDESIKPSADSKVITCGTWKKSVPVQWQLLQDKEDYWIASRVGKTEASILMNLEAAKKWHYDRAEVKKTPEGKVYEITLASTKETLDLLEGSIKNQEEQVGHVEQSDECKAIAAMCYELAKMKIMQEKVQ